MRAPESLSGLTAEWLTGVLGVAVTGVESTPIAIGEGFMSSMARLELTYGETFEPELPRTLVAKLPSEEPGSVALGQMLRLWEREARFYLDVAPHLPVRTARCYFAGGDQSTGLWSLLLEDLGDMETGDQVLGATLAQAEAAVDWLAQFHGFSALTPALQRLDWLPDVSTDPMYLALEPMLEAVWPRFVEMYGDVCPPGSIEIVEKSKSRLTESLSDKAMAPTILHADYRLDNLFFGSDGEVVVIDWQAPALGQALYDLAYFVTGSCSVALRRSAERDLVRRWSDGVRRAGGTVLAEEEVWREYRRAVLSAMTIIALLAGQLDITVNERAVALAHQTLERMYTAGLDLEVSDFLDI
jgi:Ecdysteroid kinase-like family